MHSSDGKKNVPISLSLHNAIQRFADTGHSQTFVE